MALRAAGLSPFDTDTVLRLADALVAIGDRAAAMRSIQRYEELLRTELGLGPDPKVVRMIQQLRGTSAG